MPKPKAVGSSSSTYSIQVNNTNILNSWVLDTGCGFHICSDMQGLKGSEEVEHEKLKLIIGNKQRSVVTGIWSYNLMFDSIRFDLDNCYYSP